MHIILGALGSAVTILWLLHRLAEMGIDLGGLNPWLWRRRRNWRQKYEANPIFGVKSPLEATTLLMTAVAIHVRGGWCLVFTRDVFEALAAGDESHRRPGRTSG